jgi:cytochrome P450
MLARWSLSGQKVRLAPELIKLLSGISARLLAGGANLEEGFGLQVVQLVAEFQKNPVGKTYKDTKRYVFQTVEALLEEARGGQMGILSVYAFEVSEGRMTTDQAVAEVTGFFNASVETTANLLAWLVYHLAQDPERWATAQQEVDALFRGRTVVDAHELEQLSYLYQCADEAARLAPAVWRQLRKVGNSHMVLEYGERTYQLPQHAQVFNFVMHIQTDPQIWGPESKSFNPEGLTAERIAALPKGAFAPWSQGIHMCPGVTKSKMDLVIILAHILRTYQTVGFDERHQPVLGPVLAFPHHAEMWFVPRQR